MEKQVLIVMGSRSDLPSMEPCMQMLKDLNLGYTVRVLSAHRTPDQVLDLSRNARKDGYKVIIAAAGGAAHLAGVLASSTILPVIGIPMPSGLQGLDSLLSTVQMPGGVPVATVAIGKAGAKNAALLAAQIIGVADEEVAAKVAAFKEAQARSVLDSSYLEEEA